MTRAERRRQEKNDAEILRFGVDPENRDTDEVAALARQLFRQLEKSKRSGSVDNTADYLNTQVDLTLKGLRDVEVACKRSCSHCCNIWVSVSAFEAIRLSKIIKNRKKALAQKVYDAAMFTHEYGFDQRDSHPHPCPMLAENLCSIYENRPHTCRLASSADAETCARSYMNISEEDIPTPFLYVMARSAYAFATSAALRRAGFSYYSYELNEALSLALDRDDAERAWLSGEDIFARVRRDPGDPFAQVEYESLYRHSFLGHL